MKQPELGQKILELRKAKGLTQEELVELCNINVRTIQRIEAGEVTPRSYTIKSILEVLGYDFKEIQYNNEEPVSISPEIIGKAAFLRTAFFVGIVYFLLAFVEGVFDYGLWEAGEKIGTEAAPWYIAVKIGIMLTFGVFTFGYYKLSMIKPNIIVKAASILLIIATCFGVVADIYGYNNASVWQSVQFSKAILFGALYIVFGLGLIRYQTEFGSLALVTGILSIISGIAFLSIILAIPGLFVFTIFEILQLVLLYKAYESVSGKSPSPKNLNIHAFG
ncbi:helix-turn-helix domain-containing protein [Aquiflexum gelatinilyticum]|uniref:helix-turn-helix domain-containing protein n=1 Tax=Aquiflexum gelatinilyticum TaxID=2961943 RepID=UPI00216A0F28|nr:helix-turn-helix transcriptional regulator [Aquiflexum gelatinilyticum]MCS4433569.1 helix-turn-helix transcriptional regulator [Aquiflexum gelatinilyticum]